MSEKSNTASKQSGDSVSKDLLTDPAMSTTAVVARNIKRLRTEAGMTQKTLIQNARELGYKGFSKTTFSKIEQMERKVTPDELTVIATVLNVPLVSLFRPQDGETLTGIPQEIKASTIRRWLDNTKDFTTKAIETMTLDEVLIHTDEVKIEHEIAAASVDIIKDKIIKQSTRPRSGFTALTNNIAHYSLDDLKKYSRKLGVLERELVELEIRKAELEAAD